MLTPKVDVTFFSFTSSSLSWKTICALQHDTNHDECSNEAYPTLSPRTPVSLLVVRGIDVAAPPWPPSGRVADRSTPVSTA